jgi:hypothetical protein
MKNRYEGLRMANAKRTRIGRNAITGRFMRVAKAQQHPKTSVVETIKKGEQKKMEAAFRRPKTWQMNCNQETEHGIVT